MKIAYMLLTVLVALANPTFAAGGGTFFSSSNAYAHPRPEKTATAAQTGFPHYTL